MEKTNQNKNIYRLWYEYLKRSDNYNRLCKSMREEKIKFDPPKTLGESMAFTDKLICFT
jgi:hypothetical protein